MEVGGWVALGYLTQAVGLQTTDASVCAFLCSLTVVSVLLLRCGAKTTMVTMLIRGSLS